MQADISSDADITGVLKSLTMASGVEINVYFDVTEGYTGTFEAMLVGGDREIEVVKESATRYRVDIKNISAHLLGNMYTLKVTTENGTATVKVSALSYAYSALNNEANAGNTNLLNAMAAIYYYYKAAYELKYGN